MGIATTTEAPTRGGADDTFADAIDLAALLNRCMGKPEFAERLLRRLRASFPEDLTRLEILCGSHDARAISSAAHQMKGTTASASASSMTEIMRQIENLATNGQLAEIPKQLTDARREWQRVDSFIATHGKLT